MMDLNLDFYENIVIFKALTDTQYLSAIIDYIRPEYFKKTEIRDIFEVIAKCFERTSKVPTITEIKTYLKDEAAINSFKRLVESFRDIDKNLDQDELYKNTERFIKERAVYETVLNVAKDISNGKVDTSEILLNFEKSCNVNLVTDSGFDLYRDIDDLIHDLNNTQATIPTGWKWLDENIGGGFLENGRAIYVFAGETNIGKSIVLGNLAANFVDRGKNVLLVSLEMPELLYAKRICSNVTKIPQKELGQNCQTLRQLIKEQGQAGKGRLLIKEFPPSTITCNQLKVFIKRIIDSGIKIDLIVLDYINLMHSTIGVNSYERVKHITEQLRALTYVFNCPLASATQLGRSGVGVNNPGIEMISESMGLSVTSDVMVSIFQSEEDREMGIIRFGMMKNRFGPRGMQQPMRIDYKTLSIEQSDCDMIGDDDTAYSTLALLED